MKKIKYIILAVLPLLMVGCSSSFLDTDINENASSDQISKEIARDPNKLKGFLSGNYKNVFAPEAQASHDDFGLKALQLAMDLMTDDIAYKTSGFFVFDYDLDNRGSKYRRSNSTWQQFYAIINGANEIIKKVGMIDDIPANTDEEIANKNVLVNMVAQSYVLRAYAYFWLINMYQQPYEWNKDKPGIPIYTETEIILSRAPVKDVYTQIIADIDYGYKLLEGKTASSPDKSQINEYSAAAIYAKVLEFVNDYPNQKTEIVKYAKLAIAGGALMTSKDDLLSGFNSLDLSEVLWGSAIDKESNTFYASFMSHMDPYSPGYGGDLGNYKMVASELLSEIPDTDVRKDWFGISLPEDNPHYPYRKYIQKKFVDVGSLGKGEVFASDYIYLRVAEMYFIAAEALYNDGKQEEARTMLEQVVKTRNPQYSTQGKDLLDEIKTQKRIEMWGEGTRLLDMKRRGEGLNRTKSTNHNVSTKMEVPANDKLFIYRLPDKEVNANDELGELND